ncbi:MAG: hypothetical protein HY761_04530 [Candidatus Omnitrophica bacterium]|nr:hypothetical protein [Candidatus Omnitrophota bacterium]
MRTTLSCFLFLFFAVFIFFGDAHARLNKYTQDIGISQVEWQLMNQNIALRGSNTFAAPFVLNNISFSRDLVKIVVEFSGDSKDATDENLQKSLEIITKFLRNDFSEFDPNKDLVIDYKLTTPDPDKMLYIKYKGKDEWSDGGLFERSEQPIPDVVKKETGMY